jgi:hypothetical protein
MFIYQLQVSALSKDCVKGYSVTALTILVAAIDYDNGPPAGFSLFLLWPLTGLSTTAKPWQIYQLSIVDNFNKQ